MKTKKLIALLNEVDPTGEMHVTVGKEDIYFLHQSPSSYDGYVQKLILDESCEFYNIVGAEFPKEDHITLVTVGLKWALLDDPDLPIDCGGDRRIKAMVEEWREEMRKIIKECDE